MGKGKRNQHDHLTAELEAYMSDDDNEDLEALVPVEELEKGEVAKAVLFENLPVTTPDKVEKLQARLEEFMRECDEANGGFKLQLPVDESGNTLGFGFGYFEVEESARTCQKLMHNLKLGKYEIKVYPYGALDQYLNLPDAFPPQQKPQYQDGIDADAWLYDGREQFVMRQGLETLIYWTDNLAMGAETELAYGGEREKAGGKVWCRGPVMWSPHGKYLMTFHPKGLVIWGGSDFQRVGNFPHANVSHAEFSPCERFLVTFAEDSGDDGDQEALIVWNVRTQTKVKAFADPRYEQHALQPEWPFLQWSYDGAYFARTIENGISVFSSNTMKLLEGKPVALRGIAEFSWSPSDNLVGYWCPEVGDVPAKVVIFDPINKKELRSKNLFNVSSVKLHWHPQGDFLCAQVTRHTKTKKTTFTNFEVFRMRDSGCPNETLSMHETISHFSFEPNGVRFAIVHSEIPDGGVKAKMNVSIHTLGSVKNGSKLELFETLENRPCQETIWSPLGGILVLTSLDKSALATQLPPGAAQPFAGSGAFEFYDVDQKMSLAHFDHYLCNEAKWDPSGRFFITIASQPMFGEVPIKYTLENGYKLFNFLGQKLAEESVQDFYLFYWRPRPKTLLTDEELEEIRKKLTQTIKRLEKEDAMLRKRKQAVANAERVRQLEEFRSMMEERHQIFLEYQQKRVAAGIIPKEEKEEVREIVERVEELVSEKVEIVQ